PAAAPARGAWGRRAPRTPAPRPWRGASARRRLRRSRPLRPPLPAPPDHVSGAEVRRDALRLDVPALRVLAHGLRPPALPDRLEPRPGDGQARALLALLELERHQRLGRGVVAGRARV